MTIKTNEATRRRPLGDRIIDAPYVITDLQKSIYQLKSEEAWLKNDRNAITVFKTDGVTIVLSALHAGAVLDNNPEGLVTVQVLEGRVNIALDTDVDTSAHQLLVFHPGVPYAITAVEDSVLLLTVRY